MQDRRVAPAGWQESDTAAAHPLWQFFHNKEPLPRPDERTQISGERPSRLPDQGAWRSHPCHVGRAWLESELRRKSFEHLHQLWFILIKERGVLLTQRHEAVVSSRVNLNLTTVRERLAKVRKSMGRIKLVINERRLALTRAHDILVTEDLVERYPALAQFDATSRALLQRQGWLQRARHRSDPSPATLALGVPASERWHTATKALVVPRDAYAEPPPASECAWEWAPPEPHRSGPASGAEAATPRAFLERALRQRRNAALAFADDRRSERAMKQQAERFERLLKGRQIDAPLPPVLAKYVAPEVAPAIEAGLPAPIEAVRHRRRPSRTRAFIDQIFAKQRQALRRIHGPSAI